MQAFPEFRDVDSSFWALVKYVSETLGYTDRRTKTIRTYSIDSIVDLLEARKITAPSLIIQRLKKYFDNRALLLNNYVRQMLMTADDVRAG